MLSLIIPARNESALLPRLLETVEVARARYHGGRHGTEVILADNLSTDDTPAIARRYGCSVVEVPTRTIGAVRNAGARAATGSILLFVDADSRIHPQTFNAVEAAIETGRVVGGATGVRLERWSVGIALTYAAFVPLVWLTRFDTGVTFCRRDAFVGIGGYREPMRFAEDVMFLWDLQRWGRARGLRLRRVTSAKAIASTRKFDRFGDWHYLTTMFTLPLRMLVAPHRARAFVQRYWYDPRD